MSSRLLEAKLSAALIAKCSKCKTRSELEVCEVCDEAKCKTCATQHLMEIERWDAIETTLLEIDNKRKKYIIENKKSLDSLNTSLRQLHKTYKKILDKLKIAYDDKVKQMNGLVKIYRRNKEHMAEEWKLLETNKIYKKLIESGYHCLLTDDPTELEIVIERIQYYFREEASDQDYAGKQFNFEPNNQTLCIGRMSVATKANVDYSLAPRRLKSIVRRQYTDIEERIARVTDSKRKNDDLLCALKGPLSTRETRMEAVAWIAVCQFNCRIFGGFVRDWIVGGYSAKPTIDTDPSTWITYTSKCGYINDERIPHINKDFVPNDIDCYLPDSGFNIKQFLDYLRKYEIECGSLCKLRRGYVLLLDKDQSPFTMDLISPKGASKFQQYHIIDVDVNNLYVEKDYRRALGMRTDPTLSKLPNLGDLETIVKNIKDTSFRVIRTYDIDDRIGKLKKRGWTQLKTNIEDHHAVPNDDYINDGC